MVVTSPIYFPGLWCREYANKATSPIILFLYPPQNFDLHGRREKKMSACLENSRPGSYRTGEDLYDTNKWESQVRKKSIQDAVFREEISPILNLSLYSLLPVSYNLVVNQSVISSHWILWRPTKVWNGFTSSIDRPSTEPPSFPWLFSRATRFFISASLAESGRERYTKGKTKPNIPFLYSLLLSIQSLSKIVSSNMYQLKSKACFQLVS